MKRGFVVLCSAVAFAAAPLVVAAPAAASCPWGTSERSPGVCTKGGAGVAGNPVVIPGASAPGAVVTGGVGQLPSVSGIPCTPENLGKCIALQQSQG